MTMRLDVVTNDAGELVRRERARELGASVVVDLYRLIKLVQLHDLANAAMDRQREQTLQTIHEYCLRAGANVSILFAHKAIFVGGQLLKGSRAVYESAVELSQVLERLGGSEVVISRDITRDDIQALAEALSQALRGHANTFRSPTPRFSLRYVNDAARLRGLELEQLTDEQRAVRTYASAVVIMRRFFENLEQSRYMLPKRVKRVAQTLVDLSAGSTPAFLGVTELRNANMDAAGRAVNTAILAVLALRQVSSQRAILVQAASAAMLYDVARPRALAMAGGEHGAAAELSEDQEDLLAAGTAAVLTALGRLNQPSVTRTVVAFEAQWMRRERWLGSLYGGARLPTLQARLIRVARRYNDLLTPEPGVDPPGPSHAIAVIASELTDPKDFVALRLLVAGLDIVPTGSVVRLNTREVGEVIAGGSPERPIVRISMAANGALLDAPRDVDLRQALDVQVESILNTDGWHKGREDADDAAYDPDADDDDAADSVRDVDEGEIEVEDAGPEPLRAEDGGTIPPSHPAPDSRDLRGAEPPAQHMWRAAQPQATELRESSPPPSLPVPSYGPPAMASDSPASNSWTPPSGQSFESAGTSPSRVAEAFGRSLRESNENASLGPSHEEDARTMFVPSGAAKGVLQSMRLRTREPSAQGSLETTPLAHVLVYMLDNTLTGSILFTEPRGVEHLVYFDLGVPAQVRIGHASPRLGEVLQRLGLVDAAAMQPAAIEARRLGLLFGEYLVGEGTLARHDLQRALEAQLTERIASMANLPSATQYAYFADVNLLAEETPSQIENISTSALNLVLAVVREWQERSRIGATLARVAKHPLALAEDADLSAFAFTSEEESVLQEIRTSAPRLGVLTELGIAEESTVATLVYTFSITRQFAFKGQKKGPMAPRGSRPPMASAPPLPPRSDSAMPGAPAHGSEAPARTIMGQSHASLRPSVASAAVSDTAPPSSLSGVPSQAPPRTVVGVAPPGQLPVAAGQARGTRPKIRLRADAPVSVRPGSTSMPAATPASGGYRAAPAPQDRAPSVSRRTPEAASPVSSGAGPNTQRGIDVTPIPPEPGAMASPADDDEDAVERAIRAMSAQQLAESALARGDLRAAEAHAAEARREEPEQVEYALLHLYVRAQLEPSTAADAIDYANLVLANDPSDEKALLFRARLYRDAGRAGDALADFRTLMVLSPGHPEAEAAVRSLRGR